MNSISAHNKRIIFGAVCMVSLVCCGLGAPAGRKELTGHVKPVVIMEDEPTHTEENGYCCGQAGCPCMADESEEATE